MAVSQYSFDQTHEWLNVALAHYHRLRDDVEEADQYGNGYIALSVSPKVLRRLGHAALAHANSMERWTDDVYLQDLSSGSDDID